MNTRIKSMARSNARLILTTLITFALSASGYAATASPCVSNPQSRELDYWVGNWRIGAAGSSGNAHSTVSLALDKCLVVENWDGGRGHSGENVFGYSADDKSWYGLFADNEGRVHVFTSGNVSSGSARFEGASRGGNGETVLNRVTIVRLNPDRVQQTWEKSHDNGSSWKVVFHGEYSRVKP